jgi:3-deoxy-D-manno-octulosonate 8-phosphate phosphatase (KDO 8-P phosphatase)
MIIKLLLIDVDGVMTDGTKVYEETHDVIYKRFCDLDFTAIKRLAASGVQVCLVSGDDFNRQMAQRRKIDFVYSRQKEDELPELLNKYGVSHHNVAFIGDDLFDYEIMRMCEFAFCPRNSPRDLQQICQHVVDRHSGDGVIAQLYDDLVAMKLIKPAPLTNISGWHSC